MCAEYVTILETRNSNSEGELENLPVEKMEHLERRKELSWILEIVYIVKEGREGCWKSFHTPSLLTCVYRNKCSEIFILGCSLCDTSFRSVHVSQCINMIWRCIVLQPHEEEWQSRCGSLIGGDCSPLKTLVSCYMCSSLYVPLMYVCELMLLMLDIL